MHFPSVCDLEYPALNTAAFQIRFCTVCRHYTIGKLLFLGALFFFEAKNKLVFSLTDY